MAVVDHFQRVTLARKEKRLLVGKWNKVEDPLKIQEEIFITPYALDFIARKNVENN